MNRIQWAAIAAGALLPFCLIAAPPEGLEELPDPPPPPKPIESGKPFGDDVLYHGYEEEPPTPEEIEGIEPEITIIQREDATVEEYRMGGRLYMVKIKPAVGPAYYLVDRNGDGLMESKITNLYNEPKVPQWVIFSW